MVSQGTGKGLEKGLDFFENFKNVSGPFSRPFPPAPLPKIKKKNQPEIIKNQENFAKPAKIIEITNKKQGKVTRNNKNNKAPPSAAPQGGGRFAPAPLGFVVFVFLLAFLIFIRNCNYVCWLGKISLIFHDF